MLPFRTRVDLGVMIMKGYSALPKAPASLKPHPYIVYVKSRTFVAGSYPSAEKRSVYSTVQADWAISLLVIIWKICKIN